MTAHHPHPVVTIILNALDGMNANVSVSRVAVGRLDVDLELRAHDGRRIVVNVKEML